MKRLFLALLACATMFAVALPSRATSAGTADYSDLWWNAGESGWVAHVTLQDNVVFLVLFVYDSANQARFFVASDMERVDFSVYSADTYVGDLYTTQGPPFAGAFNPALVSSRVVGNARLTFETPGSAVLSYTVDGVTVTKAITRQQWRPPDLTGEYKGGLFAAQSACFNGLPTLAYRGSVSVRQSGDMLTIDSTFAPGFAESGACRHAGRMTQQGSVVSILQGTYTCEFQEEHNTVSGTFALTAIESGANGFSGRYLGQEGGSCVHSGYLGGIRRGYPDLPPAPEEPPPE